MNETKQIQVWSCGGGVQSCAIAALIVQGEICPPDIAVMANTTRECGDTWKYFDEVLFPNLRMRNVYLWRISKNTFSNIDLWSGAEKETVVIPAYSTMGGLKSKLPNYCTNEWKVRVIDRWLRTKGINPSECVKWIGFSIDETTRVLRMQKSHPETRFPLVEQRMSRRDCLDLVKSIGWPEPPRSRCWMCPNQGDHEWRSLPPDEFKKAVELEREIHKVDPDAWLHRSCVPLDQVDFSQPEDLFSRPCDSGMCFV